MKANYGREERRQSAFVVGEVNPESDVNRVVPSQTELVLHLTFTARLTCVRGIDSHVWLISVGGIQNGGGMGVGGGQTQFNACGLLTCGDN